ncbi:hypothetical protein [Streptomyces lavendulae]|uniref:hypothetical protein n=1 Tax=Streptomyces lavendulae TaxID=1914 RepID=UPI00380AE83F
MRSFFGVFPEATDFTVRGEVDLDGPLDADLVVFAFQVWYLAPSPPSRAALHSLGARLSGRDVIALTACRNMWYSAALDMQRALTGVGARYRGIVAAVDTHPPLFTAITTVRWMLTGCREPFGIFPRAGVGAGELARLRTLGERLARDDGTAGLGQRVEQVLADADAAPVAPVLAAADLLTSRLFSASGKAIRASTRPGGRARQVELAAVAGGIVFLLVVGVPAVAAVRLIASRRFDHEVMRRLAPAVRRLPEPRKSR